jgi:hypothetical protein
MAQPIPPLDEQPNLDDSEHCWSEMLVEVKPVRDIPALNDGNRIIAAIEQMTTRLETRLQGVETRLQGMETRHQGTETRLQGVETRLQGMETRLTQRIDQFQTSIITSLKAYDTNAVTRVVNNNNVTKPNHDIEPLLDVVTGTPIPNFPTTVNQIMNLQRMSPLVLILC